MPSCRYWLWAMTLDAFGCMTSKERTWPMAREKTAWLKRRKCPWHWRKCGKTWKNWKPGSKPKTRWRNGDREMAVSPRKELAWSQPAYGVVAHYVNDSHRLRDAYLSMDAADLYLVWIKKLTRFFFSLMAVRVSGGRMIYHSRAFWTQCRAIGCFWCLVNIVLLGYYRDATVLSKNAATSFLRFSCQHRLSSLFASFVLSLFHQRQESLNRFWFRFKY